MQKSVVGFHFQEIPLEEAKAVALAGNGNYSELKEALLEKLPQLAPDRAFAFGLPNGKEMPDTQRKGKISIHKAKYICYQKYPRKAKTGESK